MQEAKGKANGFLHGLVRTLDELLSPQALMTTTGFTMGMVILGFFSIGTVSRLVNLLTTGSFLLGGSP